MGYVLIDNLVAGVDRSRPRFAGPAGSMWSAINAHVTRGGDVEKRKAFSAFAALPPTQTFGLAKTTEGLYTFGSSASATLPVTTPTINYMSLPHPTNPALLMTRLASWDLFNGKLYVIAEYSNGDLRHFYDGVVVADWGLGGNNPSAFGSIAKTHKRKLYSPIISILWFSQLDTPNNFDDSASGSGFVNMSNHQSGSDLVTALVPYQDLLAVFSRNIIQFWNMQDDDANNVPVQYLNETGTRAPRSAIGYGDLDAFYLADSGIRSLRARIGTNTAGVNDVGSPIDPLIIEWMQTLTSAQITNAVGIVEPVDGRYWLALGSRIFVFSYFPSKKVSAWSWYEPGFTVSDLVSLSGRIYARAGDTLYQYGGSDNATYDSSRVTVELPFLAGGKPGTYKEIKGFDMSGSGAWNVKMLVNPRDENDFVDVGDVDGISFNLPETGMPAHVTHMALKLINEAPGYASLSQFAIHNDAAENFG